jgi:uncharacterized protein YndB with AHSA1/START domain
MKTILHAVHVHTSPARVYEALTTRDGLAGWWSTTVELDEGQGGVIRFTFHGDFHPQMKQTALERDRKVGWQCVGGHPNWQDNTFSFTIEPRKSEALLTFGIYNFNWGYYLNSLKLWCETGRGVPFVPPAA